MNSQVLTFQKMEQFTDYLFDPPDQAPKAALILQAILDTRSPRLSDLSQAMPGHPSANYKAIQRFLEATDPREALGRLFQEAAPFVLADPTEIPRPQAQRTAYVGKLQDGQTRGFQVLVLAVPYRGRAIPFHFISYSSQTIGAQATSRNLEHRRALGEVQELLGDKSVVLDREFSYEGLFQEFIAAGMKFVIRLNTGTRPRFTDAQGKRVVLSLAPGQRVSYRGLWYKGRVPLNVAGKWEEGFAQPLWVITNLEPEEARSIYEARMKIDESFKDLKSLLSLEKVMNKKRENMEKMVALVLVAYAIGLLVGEAVRDELYAEEGDLGPAVQARKKGKWRLYSGLFVLLKQKIQLGREALRRVLGQVQDFFRVLVYGHVRSPV